MKAVIGDIRDGSALDYASYAYFIKTIHV